MVLARPRVAIVSTGNEVVAQGQRLGPGQIYDINRHTLSAVVADHGGVAVPLAVAADTLEALDRAVDDALTCDVIVFSGGSSVGDRDLVLDVLRRRGEVAFHGIATRPGKPTAFGRIGEVPVFGMPGNPDLVPHQRLRAAGAVPETAGRAAAASAARRAGPLARRVTSGCRPPPVLHRAPGRGRAEPAFKASGDITSMAHADGYIGDRRGCRPRSRLGLTSTSCCSPDPGRS